jgi:hypothetical protein
MTGGAIGTFLRRPVLRRLLLMGGLAAALVLAGCGSQAVTKDDDVSSGGATPVSAALGWFAAINAHNRPRALSYLGPYARRQLGWMRGNEPWGKWTNLHCRRLDVPTSELLYPGDADVECTFHESAVAAEPNPQSFWDIYLYRSSSGWLIHDYGQG